MRERKRLEIESRGSEVFSRGRNFLHVLNELYHSADSLKNAKLAGKMSPGLKGFSGGALTGNGDFDKISPRDEAAAANRSWPGNVSTSRAIILNITQGARLNLSPPRPPSSFPQS